MSWDIDQYIVNCHMCWRSRNSKDWISEFLHSLLISQWSWQHVSMNFMSLSKNKHRYNSVFMIVNRLSKWSISISCTKKITVKNLARMYVNFSYWIYKLLNSAVFDWESQFISAFWNELCCILSVKLKLSTADHLQTDGQTEIVN